MNVLDSPVDALIFDYVGFGILTVVNNLWTWVAVLTAAVSFWRLRAAGAGAVKTVLEPPVSSDCIGCNVTESSQPEPTTSSASASVTESVIEAPLKPVTKGSASVFEDSGVTKGKFVVYYYQDDRENESSVDGDGGGDLTAFGKCGGGGGWERMLRLRMGDFGWYNCQDLMVINGNVVRLWDGLERRSTAQAALFRPLLGGFD